MTTTHEITTERYQSGVAYARNGNAHRPTRYYRWIVLVDGKSIGTVARKRDAADFAADYIRIDLEHGA